MRIPSSSVIAILVTTTCAQSYSEYLQNIPVCALTCIAAGAVASGCGSTDYDCICGAAKPTVIKNITPCIASGCSVSDALTAQKNALQVCAIISTGGSNSTSTTTSGSISSTALSTSASAAVTVLSGSATKTSDSTQATSVTSSTPSATSASSGERLKVMGSFAGAGVALLAAFVI